VRLVYALSGGESGYSYTKSPLVKVRKPKGGMVILGRFLCSKHFGTDLEKEARMRAMSTNAMCIWDLSGTYIGL